MEIIMWIKLTEQDFDRELRELHINMNLIIAMTRSEGVTTLHDLHGCSYEVIDTIEQIHEAMNRAIS